jgi:CheY-like chemotaxis protein
VLVVDDNATNRRVLEEQLAPSGMSVAVTSDGPSALEELREAVARGKQFRIAILDRAMPGMDGVALARAIMADDSLSSTQLVLLTSLGETDDELAGAGIQHILTKPVRQSELLNTIAELLGVRVRRTASIPATVAPRNSATDGSGTLKGPRVLLAEDTVMNQLVARRMLERLGCRVDVANNGREAIRALKRIRYALVLMDVRMPEMNGFDATDEIRRYEARTGRHTPIIAMTAGAMESDREHCIAAGMDDYLSKPIRLNDFEGVLRRWVYAQAVVGTDLEPWLVNAYLANEPALEQELLAAVQSGNAPAISAAAQRLKGMASTVGANDLVSLCAQIEQPVEDGSPHPVEIALERFIVASGAVRDALQHMSRSQ